MQKEHTANINARESNKIHSNDLSKGNQQDFFDPREKGILLTEDGSFSLKQRMGNCIFVARRGNGKAIIGIAISNKNT